MAGMLIFTNDNCIGCNKCIKVCSSTGACISHIIDGRNRIFVDNDKCVGCGACIEVCEHKAREYNDDTKAFLEDLKRGDDITLLVAPSFKANYPDDYKHILGKLKKLGVKRFINVSFGADITTWAYIKYIKEHNFTGGISQPCPAVVSYIEKHIPTLIPKLMPIQSPLICSAIYARKELGITDKFAFLSPCIAKKNEIEDPNTHGYVSYNVTFRHLIDAVSQMQEEDGFNDDEIESGLGGVYPMPGGLKENVRWFLGEKAYVRQIDGEKNLYHYLENNKDLILKSSQSFDLIDALNCSLGCISGTGCEPKTTHDDGVLQNLLEIRKNLTGDNKEKQWMDNASCEERLEALNKYFEKLDLNDYIREYTDKSGKCVYHVPTEEKYQEIFLDMNKKTEEEKTINCATCGYDSCKQMALAIYNGFNTKENCIYYLRREAEDFSKKLEMSNASNEAKKVFLTNMSHEIRTPINGILGMNAAIMKENTNPTIAEYSKNIENAGNMLLAIVNDVLDLSKIESGKLEMNVEEYDLPLMIKNCYMINESIVKDKGLGFEFECKGYIPKTLEGDVVRIRQIVMNLISNAYKYTKEGRIKLSVRWNMTGSNNGVLTIAVSDTGVGISREDMPKLFEAFNRLNEKKNRYIQGTGLGLPISKKFAELMGGTISVNSKQGEGSTFRLTIPQKVVGMEMTDKPLEANENITKINDEEFSGKGLNVLAVDDVVMNLKVLCALLKSTEVAVETALSGEEAIKKSTQTQYDIIFMDHMMPEMDGIETTKHIREREDSLNRSTPVVVVTANAIRGVEDMYVKMGFDDYISKPITRKNIIAAIEKHVKK